MVYLHLGHCLIRPPDIVVGGLRFYRDSSPIFFIRQLPSELTQPNSNKTCHMFESECELKMHVHLLSTFFNVFEN